jgi:hypothetical protein
MKKVGRVIYWAPRISSIIMICFLALFSLDVFSSESSIQEIVVGLIMHNIPVFVLIMILIVSWRYELVGGIAFTLAGLIYIMSLFTSSQFEWYMLSWSIIIAGPAFAIGALFFMNWHMKKQEKVKPADRRLSFNG